MDRLSTERMVLRRLQPEDVDNLVLLNSDPAVQEFLREPPPTAAEMADWICRVNHNWPSGTSRGFWAAEENSHFVGWFHLRPARDTTETELGYRLVRAAWGRGLATEASRKLLELAQNEPVIARTMVLNLRSRRVMEKLGMRAVRTFATSNSGPDNIVEYSTRPELQQG